MAKTIYLDYAAATPLDSQVLTSMQPYLTDIFYNPSAPYQPAREVRNDIEKIRAKIASIVGAKPTEIIFTAGATESINLAFTVQGHCIVSAIEHQAVLESANQKEHSIVGVDEKGRVDIKQLSSLIRDDTTLVSIGMVNNETGTIQDLKAVRDIIQTERIKREKAGNTNPIYFHTDASQAVGMLDINTARIGVDLMTLNGAKIYGPKQTGILFVNSSVHLQPIVKGGGQERGMRSGTENVAGIIGFAKALELADKKRKTEVKRLQNIRNQMMGGLKESFKDLIVIGDQKHCTPHILTVAWQGLDAERVLFALESKNILVATGSACGANKDTRSHVLTSLGLKSDVIDGSLRFSFGRQTTTDIEQAVKMIAMVIKQELARASEK